MNNGVVVRGIPTPIIKKGNDLLNIAYQSVIKTIGMENIHDNDIIAITEAVVAISQGNIVNSSDITKDISHKFSNVTTLGIVDPIQSRNRFLAILKAIATAPNLKKIYIFMTYPADEVGNHLISEEALFDSNVNPYSDIFTAEKFYSIFGTPSHPFTGMNYIDLYQKACNGKAEIILINDFSKIPKYCSNLLVCSIHRKNLVKKLLLQSGAEKVLDLSEILNAPIGNSGYNKQFGLYGSNLMANDYLKLMPRKSQKFAEDLQAFFLRNTGKHLEVLVFGDGAFKDPVGGIWELADPACGLGFTRGLLGTPEEVKLKFLASKYGENMSSAEIEKKIQAEKKARLKSNKSNNSSLGTTPRKITDLLASMSDLVIGSGDRQTPIVYIQNYLS